MNRFTLIAAGSSVVLATSSAFTVASPDAAAHTHSLRLHGHALQQQELGKSHEVEADRLSKAGKTVGFATESCDFGGQGDRCAVTLTLKHGVLYGHYTFPITNSGTAPSTANGKITGGLAAYDGATGKIRAVATGTHVIFTVHYS